MDPEDFQFSSADIGWHAIELFNLIQKDPKSHSPGDVDQLFAIDG